MSALPKSPAKKMLLAPSLNPPSARMIELDRQAEPLEAELDRLRKGEGIFLPATDRVRALRKLLAKIDVEFRAEFRRVNPQWVNYWSTP